MSELVPVLLLACDFPPEHVIGAQRPDRFFRYLPEFGYEPWVVTASAQQQPNPRIVVEPFVGGITERILRRTVLPYDDRLLWAGPASRAAAALLKRQPCRIVLSTSPPFSVHLAARRLQRNFRIRWIADIRDPLIGNATRVHPASAWIDRRVEGMLEKADLLLLNTDAARDNWRSRHPRLPARVESLPNGFDPAVLPQGAPRPPQRTKRILLHAGSLYSHHYVNLLLEALVLLFDQSRLAPDNFQFELIGDLPAAIPELAAYRSLAARGAINNAARYLPRGEALARMADSDFLLLVDFYRPEGSLQLPAKIFDYLPVGRPILAITAPGSPMHSALTLSGIPHQVLLPLESASAHAAKIEQLLALPRGPHTLSREFLDRFDGRAQVAQLARWMDHMLAGESPPVGGAA